MGSLLPRNISPITNYGKVTVLERLFSMCTWKTEEGITTLQILGLGDHNFKKVADPWSIVSNPKIVTNKTHHLSWPEDISPSCLVSNFFRYSLDSNFEPQIFELNLMVFDHFNNSGRLICLELCNKSETNGFWSLNRGGWFVSSYVINARINQKGQLSVRVCVCMFRVGTSRVM